MEIQILRKKIDAIDNKIITLLEKRMKYVFKLAHIKKDNNIPIEDKNREKEIILNLSKNSHLLKYKDIKKIFNVIFYISKEYQREVLK